MARPDKKKDDKNKRSSRNNLFKRRKFCRFTVEKIPEVDYKDVNILKEFITENGKLIPARITGTRMQVAVIAMSGQSKILRVSLTSFVSSSL